MKTNLYFSTICTILFLVAGFWACTNQEASKYLHDVNSPKLPDEPYNYRLQDVKNVAIKTALQALVTDHGATLGRVLFYDKKLSKTNTVSCGSCHQQKLGFADDKALSLGFDGKPTIRNSMSICNTVVGKSFFWDHRETSLNQLVLQPVKDHIEMGMENFDVLSEKLKKSGYYEDLFLNAYGDTQITKEKISQALAQFVNSMVATTPKVSEIVGNGWSIQTIPSTFSDEETAGALLFTGKAGCVQCHEFSPSASQLLFPVTSADIGLDIVYKDKGIGETIAGSEGLFRIPSLFNVGLSAPYMHDGRFNTLEEVVEHYNSQIKPSKNLNWGLKDKDGNPKRLNLSESEKKALVSFLHTFTDHSMVSDQKYSNPFRE